MWSTETKLIKEDNVKELTKILNSNELQQNFNVLLSDTQQPLLLFAVEMQSIKVVEYLLSQDFVDKFICNSKRENIYHIVCSIRWMRAEKLFSIIESKVSHLLLLNNTNYKMNAFQIACHENATLFIAKRIYEIMKNLEVDLSHFTRGAMDFALRFKDVHMLKFVSFIDGIKLHESVILNAIGFYKFDVVVSLLNAYLYQSIPSHLRNQFHIFQFLNYPLTNINNNNYNNFIDDKERNIKEENDFDIYVKLVENNFQKIMEGNRNGNRIWIEVCKNENFDVVQLIFSLSIKEIQPEMINNHLNVLFFAIDNIANIKVIKYICKLFPSLIHSQRKFQNGEIKNAAFLVLDKIWMRIPHKLETLHFLYLKGIDIHLLSKSKYRNQIISLYTQIIVSTVLIQYLKVISQDFDYLHNEHDEELYRKPSFWKEIDNNNGDNNNNNNNSAYEQLKRVNEWKNRFEEHVLHHLSKMIQEHMPLVPNHKTW